MYKPLSYPLVFVRQSLVLSTDNESFKTKNKRAGSPESKSIYVNGYYSVFEASLLLMTEGSRFQDCAIEFIDLKSW